MTAGTQAEREYEDILIALRQLGKPVRLTSDTTTVHSQCPNHPDKKIALIVKLDDDGRGTKVKCLKSCTREEVLAGLGIRVNGQQQQTNGQATSTRTLKVTKASDIAMTATKWLWEEEGHCWIPQGHMTGFGGREGVGKSTICTDLTAKVTKGVLPGDASGTPKGVIIVSTEDDWSATIKPRLVAAGADLDRVFQVNAIEPDGLEGVLSLPADIEELKKIIKNHDVALVILDPLLTLISKKLDTHKDAEVRQALEPMTRLANDTRVSLVGLIHVNKTTEGDLLNRIMGSRALTGVPRAFLFCAKYTPAEQGEGEPDPADVLNRGPEFVFGQIKNNLAAKVSISLRYHMDTLVVGSDVTAVDGIGSKAIKASKIIFDGQVDQNIEDIVLEQEKARKAVRTQGSKAEAWLLGYLSGKEGVPPGVVINEGEKIGLSRSAIYRAKGKLGERVELVNLPTVPRTSIWCLVEERND
jgi:AAA domain